MNRRFTSALLAVILLAPFAPPALAQADAPQAAAMPATVPAKAPVSCPRPMDKPFNTAQVTTDCCKDHKGVCGCRAGKIVCCDRTISEQPGCTCHGEDGFPE